MDQSIWHPTWTRQGPLDTMLPFSADVQLTLSRASNHTNKYKALVVYELALKMEPGCAYALVRLGDIESSLEDHASANKHFHEAHEYIGGSGKDAAYDQWLKTWDIWFQKDLQSDHDDWESMQTEAAAPWKPIQGPERYTMANTIARLSTANQEWNGFVQRDGELVLERAFRLFGIETSQIEKVFKLEGDTIPRLVRVGTYRAAIDRVAYDQGLQTDKAEIIKVLQDCERSIKLLSTVLHDQDLLTNDFILELHKVGILHSRYQIMPTEEIEIPYIVPIGMFRRFTSSTTLISPIEGKNLVVFAHPMEIEAQMTAFLGFYRALPTPSTVEEAVWQAAWIHTAFINIHPFADGNGRVARLLGSIPLLMIGLPPLLFRDSRRTEYFNACTSAQTQCDLRPLADEIVHGFYDLLDFLKSLPPLTAEDAQYRIDPEAGRTVPHLISRARRDYTKAG